MYRAMLTGQAGHAAPCSDQLVPALVVISAFGRGSDAPDVQVAAPPRQTERAEVGGSRPSPRATANELLTGPLKAKRA